MEKRDKWFYPRIALAILIGMLFLALCGRLTPDGERDPFWGVEDVFK